MYANYIIKEAGWFGDATQYLGDQANIFRQYASNNLQQNASGGGIWSWIRSLILRFRNTDFIKSITNRVAKGKLERQIFKDPATYRNFKRKDTLMGRMYLKTLTEPFQKKFRRASYFIPALRNAGLVARLADRKWGLSPEEKDLFKQHQGLINSIDTSNWGDTKEKGLSDFNRQYTNDKNIRDQLYNSAKNVFDTWEEAQPKLT